MTCPTCDPHRNDDQTPFFWGRLASVSALTINGKVELRDVASLKGEQP